MIHDHDTCYAALASRDARFDGVFFTGVTSTGIYCRPVCPASTPRRENVRFFACATAAEEAGFRPCLRCRPETAPGTPAWLGSSVSVSRALRFINEGYLDQNSVTDLAQRLGLGPRHLTRLFREHLGATPVAIAQTRRAHFARNLLEQSTLPMVQVALAAGFGSVRRFNTVMRTVFSASPTELRARVRKGASRQGVFKFRIPYRPPYDWAALLGFLEGRAIPGVEVVEGLEYSRTITWRGRPGILRVTQAPRAHALELQVNLPEPDGLIDLVGKVRRMFDCGADPLAVATHLSCDPVLAPLVARRPGLRLPSAWDPFEMTVRAILGQQVSVKGATTMAGRLVTRCGDPLGELCQPGLTHLFPEPRKLAAADLQGIGLTGTRVATIQHLAQALLSGDLVFQASEGVDDFAARLALLPGIGPWTAHYVAMRALGEPDAFPASDLGLRQACEKLDPNLPSTPRAMTTRAAAWRPWRSYAALHLWQSLLI
jgi:AraC family transcriptional regulator of adaptative response / DNA-3-methyladenine glycosylase II